MKRSFSIILSSAFIILVFSGCIKDNCQKTYHYTFFQPVYKTTSEVKANIKSNAAREIENPGKLFIQGNFIFLNEIDKGIHIIDNRNPTAPHNVAFIDIPGNLDLAVKGNALYADLYTDLVTLDISDPLNVVVKKYNEGVFPHRSYGYGFSGDSSKIITNWEQRDTTITENCAGSQSFWGGAYNDFAQVSNGGTKATSSSPVGKGGSMARFAIVNNKMYTVSFSDLNVFNIASVFSPVYITKVAISNWQIETIFPMANKLFIGSQTGMYVYNIDNPNNPILAGQFSHVQSCDPVIADDNYAYVTLRTGSACQGFNNQLEILKLNNFTDPKLMKTYSLTNPHGLSKDGNLLFICDGKDGLKIFNSSNVSDLQLIKTFPGIETYDVIAFNNIAIVVAKDGMYQYDYSDVNNIHLVSKLSIVRN
ncbi:MAG: hypothetical protein ABIP35_06750 [Ginsengibacter sp.]